jgi:hypothetical protein
MLTIRVLMPPVRNPVKIKEIKPDIKPLTIPG